MRPSMGGTRASIGGMLRPSVALRDHSNVFADKKLQDAHTEVFSTDVLMEGELSKKGEGAFQSWKSRMFVLRGQELSYYGVENERCGALKGSMNVRGAHVERVDGSLTLSLTLENGNTRMLTAPNVQALMDWLTALTLSSQAVVVEPTTDAALVVDHSRTTHILLVRHGHYASSQNPALDMEGPLTDLGIEQAKRTGAFLHDYLSARGVLKRFPVFPIYHSGVRRTEQTAHHMVAELFPKGSVQFIKNKLFREAWPGNPLPSTNRKMLARENLDSMVSDCARLKLAYRTMFRHLLPSDLTTHEVPLSEQEKQHFADTIAARTTQTRVNDRYRVVVCHANIIRWFVCKALGVDPDGTWGRMRYNHCGVTALEVDSVGNVQLVNMNQTGHLHTTMLSENS
uniref:Serine/threonine-protein phosphatase PGAM5, mitochondrial n=1 Tax=Globisporangium ultimum (strain ATCC 200006 / CBS 805.95 / DAOM BR144) TaxID=431595 RepID=K3WF08_GLOUD